MSGWTDDELARVGESTELELASTRPDGSLRPYVTIWAVRTGDALYVRSAYGPENGWFRRAKASGAGRIHAGGVDRDVTFAAVDPAVQPAIDDAYRAKYGGYVSIIDTVVGPKVHEVTLRLDPRDT